MKLSYRIFRIGIPVTLQMLVQYLLSLTDAAFIGHYRSDGLTALFNALAPYFMFNAFFIALTQGISILIARNLGAGNRLRAGRYAESGFFYNQMLSFLYWVMWFFFADFLIGFLGVSVEIKKMAVDYLRILSFNFVFMGFSLTAIAVFKGTGYTFPILLSSILKTVLNIALNWVLIFGHYGFPRLGIRGAAIATVISEGIGTILLIVFLRTQKEVRIVSQGILKPSFALYRKSFLLGLPAGLEFMFWSVGQTVLIMLLNRIGDLAAAYYGVFNLMMNFSVYLYYGFGVAGMTLVANSVGEKNMKRAKRISFLTLLYGLTVCVLVAMLFLFFPIKIFSLFFQIDTGHKKIEFYFLLLTFIIFPKMLNVIAGSLIKGSGDTRWLLVTQIPGTLLIVIFAYLGVSYWHFGLFGILLIILADELWRGMVNGWKLRSLLTEKE